jgi:pimeloyl-ACP methyl ester carboxylesterase
MDREPRRKELRELAVETSGGRLRALYSAAASSSGGKAALVILHGALSGADALTPLMAAIDGARAVVLVDLPGHGGSGAPRAHGCEIYARAVLEAAGAILPDGDLVFAGESLGGIVGLRIAALAPARVRAAVLADPPLGPRAIPFVRAAYDHIARLFPEPPPPAVELAAGAFGFDSRAGGAPRFDFWPIMAAAPPMLPVLALSGTLAGDPAILLAELGRMPRIFGPDEARDASALMGSRFQWREIADGDHHIMMRAPEICAAEIESFLAQAGV